VLNPFTPIPLEDSPSTPIPRVAEIPFTPMPAPLFRP
jgi:hypothetical protein